MTVAVGAAIACCALAASAPRGGAAASDCSATSGVTVIVDFTHFGGVIERGCDPGAAADALDAVHTAGFTTAGTTQYGDAFVCRIDSLPTPKSEACAVTPPAKSSWSFYYARPTDRSWTYSNVGVLTYRPAPGTLVAFAFGDHATPGVLPSGAAVPTTTTTTTPRHTPPTSPRTSQPTSPPVTSLREPATTTPAPVTTPASVGPLSAHGKPAPSTTPPTTARRVTGTTRSSAPTTATTTPRIVDKRATGTLPPGDSGSPVPAVLTVALVALLGAGAFAVAAARRRGGA